MNRRHSRPKKLGNSNSASQPTVDDPAFQPAIEGLAKDEQMLLLNAVRIAPEDLLLQIIQSVPRDVLVQIIGRTPVRGSLDTISNITARLKALQTKLSESSKK